MSVENSLEGYSSVRAIGEAEKVLMEELGNELPYPHFDPRAATRNVIRRFMECYAAGIWDDNRLP